MLEKAFLLLFLVIVSVLSLGPASLAEEYVTYNNFDFAFERPAVWSVAEEEGAGAKGRIVLEAPALLTNPLEILWREAVEGTDAESALNSEIEEFRIELLPSNVLAIDLGTREIDGNTAYVKELYFEESFISRVAIWTAFVSPESGRLILIKYRSIFSFDDENLRGFEHLLDTWHDTSKDPKDEKIGGESAPSGAKGAGNEEGSEEEVSAGEEDESFISSLLFSSDLVAEILGSTPVTSPSKETYQNFGLSFYHPSSWSVSEEGGNSIDGSISMRAPGSLSTLTISWDQENAGSEESFVKLLTEQLRSSFEINKVDASTRTVDGEAAYVRDISLDLSGYDYSGRLVAFTSSKSGRLVYLTYLTPASSASQNLADLDRLLDSWRDLWEG
ncbi:hypothetical protein P0O24_02175 [Methanotrichaceae archaeon M04Ac]|uniref:PsbP C-terminal domain-containing protein n=1 Tax=Candidatus Methanocrinis alkalitolerans TaxID=3033395 RepID=A0ABT5XCE2_9EURY|nr:hypothetical protein [Candidatus Methanocrinis alkalitolerans]MDF0592388.1 hypothetical protein [Candidatus Methanocrinis alkalitolerans]